MGRKVIVCGDGPIIPLVATHVSELGKEVTIASPDERLRVEGFGFVKGDPAKPEILKAAGIDGTDTVLVVCKEDLDAAFIVMNSRKLNSHTMIVANANRENSTDKLYALGASRVVFSLSVSGHLIASSAVSPGVARFMDRIILTQEVQIGHLQISPGSQLLGRTLADLETRQKMGCSIIGIITSDKRFDPNPGPDSRLEPGMTLICLGPSDALARLFEMASPGHRQRKT